MEVDRSRLEHVITRLMALVHVGLVTYSSFEEKAPLACEASLVVCGKRITAPGEYPEHAKGELMDKLIEFVEIKPRERVLDKPFKVHATQGQGDCVWDSFDTIDEALTEVHRNTGTASFGIEYPDGRWHNWDNPGKPRPAKAGKL